VERTVWPPRYAFQDADTGLLHGGDDLGNGFHHDGREAHTRFVREDQARRGHQRSGNGKRLDEGRQAADTIVTACTSCHQHVDRAAEEGQTGLEIVDLPVMVANAMGLLEGEGA
jgi:hypothetical protein